METAHPEYDREERGEIPTPAHSPTEETQMAETQNFFDNPMGANGAGWGAGVGGLIGAAIGNGGLFGGNGNRETATLDQVDSRFNSLQGQLQSEALQGQIGRLQGEVGRTSADSTLALGAGLASIKDAVIAASSQNALSLCSLGHNMQAGFASVNQTVISEAARGRELALQNENARLLAENARLHSDSRHTQTQFMIQAMGSSSPGTGN